MDTVPKAYKAFQDFSLDPVNNPLDSLPTVLYPFFTSSPDIVVQSAAGFPGVGFTGSFSTIQSFMEALVTSFAPHGCYYSKYDVVELTHACQSDGSGLSLAQVSWIVQCPNGLVHEENQMHMVKTTPQGLVKFLHLEYDERNLPQWQALLSP
eukprot:TRINITY_DN104829_c0_g1_i1.p2 TRINITY_DN104829_c0_g1~~TRINITY_DN104829_c0_g1_i1.p2  ORF type:complete len:152 (-),score=6.76 TRINITY_DN104829_c0_g1_i1:53-508(-)